MLFYSLPLKKPNTTYTLLALLWKILGECLPCNSIVTTYSTTTIFIKEWNTNPWNAQHRFHNWNRFSSREWTNAHKRTCLLSTILFTRDYEELVPCLASSALVAKIPTLEGGKPVFWTFCAKLQILVKSKKKAVFNKAWPHTTKPYTWAHKKSK